MEGGYIFIGYLPTQEPGEDMQDDDDLKKAIFEVRKNWMVANVMKAKGKLVAWEMDSDNMEPTIRAGDALVIDTGRNKIQGNGIYAFVAQNEEGDGDLQIRRLVVTLDGTLRILNDNSTYPEFPPQTRQALMQRFTIVGRVFAITKVIV